MFTYENKTGKQRTKQTFTKPYFWKSGSAELRKILLTNLAFHSQKFFITS
jgi:hypothetical protein